MLKAEIWYTVITRAISKGNKLIFVKTLTGKTITRRVEAVCDNM